MTFMLWIADDAAIVIYWDEEAISAAPNLSLAQAEVQIFLGSDRLAKAQRRIHSHSSSQGAVRPPYPSSEYRYGL
jgi:hypothetical protein